MGRLLAVQSLSEVQEVHYQDPTVLLVQHIGGEEEIPVVRRLQTAYSLCNGWLCVLHSCTENYRVCAFG